MGRQETIGQTIWQYVDNCVAADDRTIGYFETADCDVHPEAIARGGASVAFMMPEYIARTDPFKQISDPSVRPLQVPAGRIRSGAHVGYARNASYCHAGNGGMDVGGKIAHFDRIEWRVIPDSATAAAALQRGEVDWYEQVQRDGQLMGSIG